MQISDCIQAVESNLYDARRFLETGEAFNWVPDRLDSALLWAMEAWLTHKQYEVNRGNGWAGTREAFHDTAPAELRSPVLACYAEVTFLHYGLEGGFDFKESVPPIDQLRRRAFECLEEAETAISRLMADIGEVKGM